jgi:hypothetical protein
LEKRRLLRDYEQLTALAETVITITAAGENVCLTQILRNMEEFIYIAGGQCDQV